ncbi:ABC transporter permease [Pedobacter sp.]|jgi:putative ABC transport system permease protein|uniref:ABC transporter permease n=1 Tax=Pedobacter sp. TaxID=1411316 RepID=UPI002BA75046|nr:ABC transporter permease [Pedobacter sp.]HWW39456.1 ABC transporter permease [Pedobacter sp.]
MFKLNLKIALRNLWKNKAFTAINISGLAIGIASCMVLLLYVAYEWGYDKQFSNYEKTYVVYHNMDANGEISSWPWTPVPMAKEIRDKIAGVAYSSHSTYPENILIGYKHNNFKKMALFAEPSFLKILDYKFIRGSAASALKNINTVILTETLAKSLFGNEDPINKTVKLGDREGLKVEGIIEDIPKNNSFRFDYLLPWALKERQNPSLKELNWKSNNGLTIIQLKDNRFFDQVSREMKGIYKRNRKVSTSEAFLQPLAKLHLYDKFENGKAIGGKIEQLRIFLVLAFCILLIACVNFMNLSTARSEKRSREVGVRKAIGSSRKSLIGQFMLESMLLAMMGMGVAFMLIELVLPYFNGLLHIHLAIAYKDWRFWSALLGLSLLTGFIAGSYPAFYLSSFEAIKVLKGLNKTGNSSFSIRKVLVVFQFIFASCLIICTSVIYLQLNYVKNRPIGYNRTGLMEIPIQGNLQTQSQLLLVREQLLKSGAVTDVTYFSQPLNELANNTTDFSWPGKNPNEMILINDRYSGYDFSKTTGTKILAGRDFSPRFADSTSILVNEAAVKTMGLKEPVGATIRYANKPYTVIGVMEDFVTESPYKKVDPMAIFFQMGRVSSIIVRLNPGENISSSIEKIDGIFKKINPDFPVERRFVNDDFEDKFQSEQLLGTLSNWFGGFSVFISCLGLLGLSLFIAEQRKKEISIRKILGASTINIVALLNKDFIKLVALANLIAFPLAYVMINTWLSGFEFRIKISILPFTIAIGLSLIIALLTVSMQSVKVVKANPVDALKYE